MAKKTHSAAVQKILKDRPMHKKPVRFDDGGYVSYDGEDFGGGGDYSGGVLPPLPAYNDSQNYVEAPNSGAPTPSEIAGLTSSATTDIPGQINSEIAGSPADLNPSGSNLNFSSTGPSSSSGNSSVSGGALSALLKALGLGGGQGANSANGLAALAGLLGAAGQYKQNAAMTPTFAPPPLFGGAPGSGAPAPGAAPSSNGGYGPPGGYNYSNYKNLTAGSPGTGFAPRTATNPNIPNYYTYGQQPQASFFSSGTPPVGTPPTSMMPAVSTGMKRGGHVKKYDIGGQVATPPPMSGAPGTLSGALTGMMPPASTAPMPAPPSYGVLDGGHAPGSDAPMPFNQPNMGLPPPTQTGLLPGKPGTMPAPPPMAASPMRPPAPAAMPPRVSMPSPPLQGQRPMINPQTMPSLRMPQGMPPRPNPVPRPVMGPQPVIGPRPIMRASGGAAQQEPMASAGFAMSNQPGLPSHLHLPPRTGTPGLPPMSGKPMMASGGSRHVQGPGDGTSDSIPARLANGEYVMDAQTVSMAGNGDNGAGAKAFDKMRENLRKHKGASLAKGKMAPDAKDLMHYLPGKK